MMLLSLAGLLAILFTFSAGMALSDAHAQTTTNVLSKIDSLALPNDGYRHNLVHLDGNYYVSSHTVTSGTTTRNHDTVIRLYSITDGQISVIGSQLVGTTGENENIPTTDANSNPRATSITAVDNNTIAVSYVVGVTAIHSGYITTYDVDPSSMTTPFDNEMTLEYAEDPGGGDIFSQSLTTLDADTLILAYSQGIPANGFIRTISIADGGALSASTPVSLASNQGRYPSVVTLDDNTVVVAYRDGGADGHIRTYDVSSTGTPVLTANSVEDLEHDDDRTAYASLVRVDGTTVALAYSEIGNNKVTDDGSGRIKVFDVDANGIVEQRGETVTYYNGAADATSEERVHLNSLALLDSNTLAVAYRGEDGDGFIRIYDITDTGLTETGGPFEHDMANGAFNALVKVDDTTLALVYGGDLPLVIPRNTANTPNTIKTLAVIAAGSDTEAANHRSATTTDDTTIVFTASETL